MNSGGASVAAIWEKVRYTTLLMKKFQHKPRSTRHTDEQQEPRRVASRMEGVVKNVGIKPKKKPKRTK